MHSFVITFMNSQGIGTFDVDCHTTAALALGLRSLEEEDGYTVLSVEEVVPL